MADPPVLYKTWFAPRSSGREVQNVTYHARALSSDTPYCKRGAVEKPQMSTRRKKKQRASGTPWAKLDNWSRLPTSVVKWLVTWLDVEDLVHVLSTSRELRALDKGLNE